MGGTSRVVAREERRELYHTVVVGLLDATQGGVVEVGSVVVVAVALALNATVHTGRVGTPDISPCMTVVSIVATHIVMRWICNCSGGDAAREDGS